MRDASILDLSQCTEFRQTLMARPPRIVHGAALLTASVVAVAVAWLAVTPAELVVRAPARVRPASGVLRAFGGSSGEEVVAATAGRVAEVLFQPGQTVRKGDVLIRLDASRLDNEIAGLEQTIGVLDDELAGMERLAQLSERQFAAAQERAGAELADAVGTVREDRGRRASQARAALAELRSAQDEHERISGLVAGGAASRSELQAAELRLSQVREAVATAQLPVGAGRVAVLHRVRDLAAHDHAVTLQQLGLEQLRTRGALVTARQRLAGLLLDKEQTLVRAHLDGIVTAGAIRVGDMITPGKATCAIAPLEGLRIDAAVNASDVAQIRIGMAVRIQLDAFSVRRHGSLDGEVEEISPDADVVTLPGGGQATYYLVRVALGGARGSGFGPLKLGMTGQVEIVTGRKRLLEVLVGDLQRAISLN